MRCNKEYENEEYLTRIRKILKSSLNSGNAIQAINSMQFLSLSMELALKTGEKQNYSK